MSTPIAGLVADPEFPADVAHRLSSDLPQRLAEVGGEREWEMRVVCDRLPHADEGEGALVAAVDGRRRREGWDLVVGLTDLPLGIGGQPVVANVNTQSHAAVVSLPAIGIVRTEHRARELVVALVGELSGNGEAGALPGPFSREEPGEEEVDVRYVASRGRLRLLAGMVRDNRPWRLLLGLSSALATAVAIGAWGLISTTVWQLIDLMGALRLTLVMLVAVAAMAVWLIADHGLWERPSRRAANRERQKARMYNASTVLTIVLGVACLYIAVFAAQLLGAAVFIDSGYLAQTLGHPVGFGDFAGVAWGASSIAIVGGALGSSFESDQSRPTSATRRSPR